MCSPTDFGQLEFNGNFSSSHLYQQEKPDVNEEGSKFNEIKHAYFLKLIRKQINDLAYKDQEIGYNILVIGIEVLLINHFLRSKILQMNK